MGITADISELSPVEEGAIESTNISSEPIAVDISELQPVDLSLDNQPEEQVDDYPSIDPADVSDGELPYSPNIQLTTADAITSFTTGFIGAGAGGLAGMKELLTGGSIADASNAAIEMQKMIAVEPKTKEGEAVLSVTMYPFEKLAELADYLGGETTDITGSPGAGTAVNVAVNTVPFLFGPKLAGKGKPSLSEVATDSSVSKPIRIQHQIKNPKQMKMKMLKDDVSTVYGKEPAGVAIDFKINNGKKPSASIAESKTARPIEARIDQVKTQVSNEIALPGTGNAIKDLANVFVDFTGGKAITPVRRLGKSSKSFKAIADKMEAPEVTNKPVGAAFYERTSMKTGEFSVKLDDALRPVAGAFSGKVPKDVQTQIIKALRGEKVNHKFKPAVDKIRTMMNDMYKYYDDAGMNVGYIKDYFPRVYDVAKITTREGATKFAGKLKAFGIDEATSQAIINKIANNEGLFDITPNKISRIDPLDPSTMAQIQFGKMKPTGGMTKGSKASNLEMSRKLHKIPDEVLSEFLVNDLYGVLNKYIEHGVRRAEWVRDFGIDGARLNNLVKEGIKESNANGIIPSKRAVNRIYDLADAMQLQYKPIQSQAARMANSVNGSYQLIRTLPLATISSLSEPLVVLMRGDMRSVAKSLGALGKHTMHQSIRTVYKKFPEAEATRAIRESGLGLDGALIERLTSAFGGEATKATALFFKANFLHQFTRWNRVLGYETGKNMIVGHLKELAAGKGKGLAIESRLFKDKTFKRYKRELTELGVDIDSGIKWINEGMNPKSPFVDSIKTGAVRFTNDVVMNPRSTVRPMWHSNPHVHFISQLKGFQTTFGNTVVKRMARDMVKRGAYENTRNAVKYAGVSSFMVLTAMLGNEIRDYIKYGSEGNPRHDDESFQEYLVRAIDRAGFTGIAQIGIDATLAHRFGSSGLAQILGPTASQIDQVAFKGVGEVIEDYKKEGESDFRKLKQEGVKAIPGVNVIPSVRNSLYEKLDVD